MINARLPDYLPTAKPIDKPTCGDLGHISAWPENPRIVAISLYIVNKPNNPFQRSTGKYLANLWVVAGSGNDILKDIILAKHPQRKDACFGRFTVNASPE
jgi:myo-inositol catabolism protein IolC